MQLLANISYENGEHKGLGWIDGQIKKLTDKQHKTTAYGLEWSRNNKITISLLRKEKLNEYYFVHSYFFDCEYKKNIIGETDYGINFTSFISKENIYGVQFHPEKKLESRIRINKKFFKTMKPELQKKINISVDLLSSINKVDLADICNITEQAIKAGGGFGWLKAPPRDILNNIGKAFFLLKIENLLLED